jgi:radical SAM protein with 4Fe4S-binding SPASM domain
MRPKNLDAHNQQCDHTKKFHQFVKVERGPVNSAIIDILHGNVFHVPNGTIDKFESGEYNDKKDFMKLLHEEKVILDFEPTRWIPELDLEPDQEGKISEEKNIELHIEDGRALKKILDSFEEHNIHKIYLYSPEVPIEFKDDMRVVVVEKNFDTCIGQATVDGDFCKAQESMIRFNKQFNSCWGGVIAITADGKIRPCIHSHIEIGNIEQELVDIDALLEKMEPYWTLTKDKVERCKDCEFRYVCIDCREISMRKKGEICGPNPLCLYNPYTGEWEK